MRSFSAEMRSWQTESICNACLIIAFNFHKYIFAEYLLRLIFRKP